MTDDKNITIGFLAPELSSRSGWARYSRSLVEAMSAKANVCVLTERDAKNDSKLTDVHAVLPMATFGLKAQIGTFLQAYRLLGSCDVIHCLVEPYAPAVALAAQLRRIPVTMTLHGTYSVPPKSGLKRTIMRYMYSRMPIVTSGSAYTEKRTSEEVKLGECRIIPNGVNLEKFHVLPGVKKEDLILSVGMLKSRKGVDTVLEALAELKEKYPKLRYAVVADDAGDAFSRKVHTMVQDLGLSDRVTFHQHISDTELVLLYNRAKIFVLAARATDDGTFEGFPMVFYEANACASPVITSRGFGSEYAIHDGKNGFLTEQEDPGAVAQAVSRLMDDPALYDHMQKCSLEEAKKHTWEHIADILMTFYHDCIRLSH
jgi:glycosyltransferase involved in cell wall biosynthesis